MNDNRGNKKEIMVILAKKTARNAMIILIIAILYYVFIRFSPITPACPFRQITGLKCPLCGVTHLADAALHLKIRDAFMANPFLFITWPLVVAELIYKSYLNIDKQQAPRWNQILVYVYIGLMFVFTIVRNIIGI